MGYILGKQRDLAGPWQRRKEGPGQGEREDAGDLWTEGIIRNGEG